MENSPGNLEAAEALREIYAQILGISLAKVSNEMSFISMGGE